MYIYRKIMENDYKPVVRNRVLQFQSQIRRETYLQYHHSILLETGMIEGKRYRTHQETRFSSSKLGSPTSPCSWKDQCIITHLQRSSNPRGGPKTWVPPNHPFIDGFSIINRSPIYGNPQVITADHF